MVSLGDRVAVAAVVLRAAAIGLDDAPQREGIVFGEPAQQRRPHVEGEVFVVVHHRHDVVRVVGDAAEGIGPVALVVDPRVPVVEWSRALLARNAPGPGVLPRRLIEMAVENESTFSLIAGSRRRGLVGQGGSASARRA